jgi:hypothetical protein
MSCRRADAAPDTLQAYVRFACTRRSNLITIHAHVAQCLHKPLQEKFYLLGSQKTKNTTPHLECGSLAAAFPSNYHDSKFNDPESHATIVASTAPKLASPHSVNQATVASIIIGHG